MIPGADVFAPVLPNAIVTRLPEPLDEIAPILVRQFEDRDRARNFAHDWDEAQKETLRKPAALQRIASTLVAEALASIVSLDASGDVARMLKQLHEADAQGHSASRAEWTSARSMVLSLDYENSPQQRAVAQLCEAGAWPAAASRSVLVEVLNACKRLAGLERPPGWSDADQARAQAALEAIYAAQEPARKRGEKPDYVRLFNASEPELAAGFERNLAHSNAAYAQAGEAFALRCLTFLRDAVSEDTWRSKSGLA